MKALPPIQLEGSFWSDIRLAYGLLPLVSFLEKRDIDPSPLLAAAGVDRFGLMDPAYTISIEQELKVDAAAIALLGDPSASLALAREYRIIGFSVLGLAMSACDTPFQVLSVLLRYPRLAWGVFDCEVQLSKDWMRAKFDAPPILGSAQGFLLERDIACAQVILSEVLDVPFQFHRIQFRHQCAVDPAQYEEFFQCDVSFGASSNLLVCHRAEVEQPLPHANPALRQFYQQQCEIMSRRLEQPFRFGDAVFGALQRAERVPALDSLAQQFFMTPRTLQRRLAAEGRQFSEVLREVRLQRARTMLAEPHRSMQAIAVVLGFSDAVAFSHAYKSWTGEPPQVYRQRVLS